MSIYTMRGKSITLRRASSARNDMVKNNPPFSHIVWCQGQPYNRSLKSIPPNLNVAGLFTGQEVFWSGRAGSGGVGWSRVRKS